MIEDVLRKHLIKQEALAAHLARYCSEPAIFNQEAPADNDCLWDSNQQYGRIVFAIDMQGDPERTMGGMLAVDIMCEDGKQLPEEIEPILRAAIHGYFFSKDKVVLAAQWKNTAYFTQPTDHVSGVTVTFDLLGFPVLTTTTPDVIRRFNEWTSNQYEHLHVINYEQMPADAWKPSGEEAAVYWRLLNDASAGWIPDTFQTIWRTATIKGHVFAGDAAKEAEISREIAHRLYAVKRLTKPGETQIMTNRRNSVDYGADVLRTGQLTIEATYGVIVYIEPDGIIQNIEFN